MKDLLEQPFIELPYVELEFTNHALFKSGRVPTFQVPRVKYVFRGLEFVEYHVAECLLDRKCQLVSQRFVFEEHNIEDIEILELVAGDRLRVILKITAHEHFLTIAKGK